MTVAEKPWLRYPEEIRETPLGALECEVFRPETHQVVMGAAGKVAQEVDLGRMRALGIPLYRRKGGGGTVLLGPETIVVTVHAGVAHTFKNLAYFAAINRALIACFRDWHPAEYATRGISDIAVGDRKIVGSSIFRRRQYLLYQASILVELNLARIDEVLRHPPRRPDYRGDRDHRAFLTSLREVGITLSFETMIADLLALLPGRVAAEIAEVDARA